MSESKQSLTDGTPASDSIDEKVFDDVSPDDFLEKPQNEFTVEIGEATGSIEDLCPWIIDTGRIISVSGANPLVPDV